MTNGTVDCMEVNLCAGDLLIEANLTERATIRWCDGSCQAATGALILSLIVIACRETPTGCMAISWAAFADETGRHPPIM
jgi:hypothetical protein